MLAYHARATTVTLDVIYFERNKAKVREISEDFNLSLFSNRMIIFEKWKKTLQMGCQLQESGQPSV
jgi:hypothetical protein